MNEKALSDRLALALDASAEAGRITLSYFRCEQLGVELKADASPVTVADRQAEQLLRDRIAEQFPDDAVLGDEFPEQPGGSGYRWILDPIDGTKSFISGVPLYGTLVGLEFSQRCVLGVLRLPALDECAYAVLGRGAWYVQGSREARPAAVSQRTSLADCVFCTSDAAGFESAAGRAAYDQLLAECRISRTWGDCYGYMLVATGRADVMLDPQMNAWDAAALQPILTEAGGTFTDWQGTPTIYSGEGLATNGHVLEQVLAITAPASCRAHAAAR